MFRLGLLLLLASCAGRAAPPPMLAEMGVVLERFDRASGHEPFPEVELPTPVTVVDARGRLADEDLPALVQRLATLPNVVLRLNGCRIGDRGLRELAGIRELRLLGLAHTGITNRAAESLARLPELRGVDVGFTDFDAEGFRALYARSPGARVRFGVAYDFGGGRRGLHAVYGRRGELRSLLEYSGASSRVLMRGEATRGGPP